jgi:hypothetical protein
MGIDRLNGGHERGLAFFVILEFGMTKIISVAKGFPILGDLIAEMIRRGRSKNANGTVTQGC